MGSDVCDYAPPALVCFVLRLATTMPNTAAARNSKPDRKIGMERKTRDITMTRLQNTIESALGIFLRSAIRDNAPGIIRKRMRPAISPTAFAEDTMPD